MIGLILALFLGILIGTITGLTPGIHINLVALFALSLAASSFFQPLILIVFIVSMSITHTFVDFIPSIFLGAPDEDTGLSVLPGHKLLLEGKAHEALIHTLYGGLIAIFLILILTPIFLFALPSIFNYLKFAMFYILILASGYLIAKEKNSKLFAFFIFILSGILGIIVLNLHLKDSLLPMLSGLFGSSSLITSLIKNNEIPKQKIMKLKEIKPAKKELANVTLAALIASPLCSFLPALGSSQAAVIGSDILETKNSKEFLMLLGSVNTLVMGLSFITLFAINKARTGSAVAVSKLLNLPSLSNLLIILAAIIISSAAAFFLSLFLSRFFAEHINKIKYNKLSIFILLFLSIIIIIFSGFLGFLVFIVSTSIGLLAISLNIRRAHLMGSMMLVSVLFYLPI